MRGDTGRTWVFVSDGEVQEGQTWEAVQDYAHHGKDNVLAIMDVNDQQWDGAMSGVMEDGDIRTKFLNFGAVCVEVDGHELTAIRDAEREPHEGWPLIILTRTNPFHTMLILEERFRRLHYALFTSEEERDRFDTFIATNLGLAPVDYAH